MYNAICKKTKIFSCNNCYNLCRIYYWTWVRIRFGRIWYKTTFFVSSGLKHGDENKIKDEMDRIRITDENKSDTAENIKNEIDSKIPSKHGYRCCECDDNDGFYNVYIEFGCGLAMTELFRLTFAI